MRFCKRARFFFAELAEILRFILLRRRSSFILLRSLGAGRERNRFFGLGRTRTSSSSMRRRAFSEAVVHRSFRLLVKSRPAATCSWGSRNKISIRFSTLLGTSHWNLKVSTEPLTFPPGPRSSSPDTRLDRSATKSARSSSGSGGGAAGSLASQFRLRC